jgi:hypothetical protein
MSQKQFPYKYVVLGLPIVLSLLASVPAIIAIKTNNKEYHDSARVAEARIQLKEMVDLVLKQETLNLDLVQLGYNPEGKLSNIYGANPNCFPKFKNTNLIEVSQLKSPVPLFKWSSDLKENLNLIQTTLMAQPCSKEGAVMFYALYADDDKRIKGWTIDLQKKIETFPDPKQTP